MSGVLAMFAMAEDERQQHFGPGTSWLQFHYPSSFKMDPKSHQGEAKWWARFVAPDGSISIETMSHGYCSDRLKIQEGYKSPEEYVLRQVIPGSPMRTRFEGYDRLIRVEAGSATVIYLRHGEEWGKCYEVLSFTFADGAYERHRDAIMRIIESARPSFGKDTIEQGGAELPANRSESE